jgi:hypothetical protein
MEEALAHIVTEDVANEQTGNVEECEFWKHDLFNDPLVQYE